MTKFEITLALTVVILVSAWHIAMRQRRLENEQAKDESKDLEKKAKDSVDSADLQRLVDDANDRYRAGRKRRR